MPLLFFVFLVFFMKEIKPKISGSLWFAHLFRGFKMDFWWPLEKKTSCCLLSSCGLVVAPLCFKLKYASRILNYKKHRPAASQLPLFSRYFVIWSSILTQGQNQAHTFAARQFAEGLKRLRIQDAQTAARQLRLFISCHMGAKR